uniref:Uncharacterized protein n=1 Tax=Panagrolaimus superbus TaxID=310955 RepID=A0A914YLG4_9BILA
MSVKNKTKCTKKGDEVGAIFHKVNGGKLCITYKMLKEKNKNLLKVEPNEMKSFIDNLAKSMIKTDAAILQIFDCQFRGFSSNQEICAAFQSQLTSLKIPYCFITDEQVIAMAALIIAKIEVKLGLIVSIMYLHEQTLNIYEYKFTKKGYKKLQFNSMILDEKDPSFKEVIDRADTNHPQHIILLSSDQANPLYISLNAAMKIFGHKVGTMDGDVATAKDCIVNEISKWLLDKTSTTYYVHPTCARKHKIMTTYDCKELLTVDLNESLPLTKSIILPRTVIIIQQIDKNNGNIVCDTHGMEQKCHRNKITLSVDANNFAKFESVPVMMPQIESLPLILTKSMESKIPVIGFYDNFSVICMHKDDETQYKFVEKWNGKYGKELYISFGNKKPSFGEEALKYCSEIHSLTKFEFGATLMFCFDPRKPLAGESIENPYSSEMEDERMKEFSSVVFDLIKIMSMPADNIKVEDSWGFRITKDDENPVLLEFKNYEKTLKLASPAFLMALLLKEHLRVMKDEIGEKPGEIGFCILDEKYSNAEKERIKQGLEEACKLLKIVCSFVKI